MTISSTCLTRRIAERRYRRRMESRGRRSVRERGAAMVEFSLVATLLVTLGIGTYEMGMAWNDAQLVTQAARSGARVAAQLGSDPQTDQRVLEAVDAALGDLDSGLVRVVIFDADAADGSMASSCQNANHPGKNGQCSVYHLTHLTTFNQGSWDPTSRNDELTNADYVGVAIEIDRPLMTGFFGGSPLRMTDTAVMRIEPQLGG
ncbi:MAG: pilus assembly protein [Acidimicrobiia bacterium]|nr:pilus assembly protein [Acidimicrobiia bacterium]MDH5520765.1 pilus assembly protein [Acidimicrobiia bacterium]